MLCATLTSAMLCSCKNENQEPQELIIENGLGYVYSSTDASEGKKNVFKSEDLNFYNIDGYYAENISYSTANGNMYIASSITDMESITRLVVSKRTVNSGFSTTYCDIPSSSEYVPNELIELVDDTTDYYESHAEEADSQYQKDYQINYSYSNLHICSDGSIEGLVQMYFSFYSQAYSKGISTSEYLVCKWDSNGNLLWDIGLVDKGIDDYLVLENIVATDDYYMIAASVSGGDIYSTIYDSNGNIKSNSKTDKASKVLLIEDIVPTGDGKYAAFYTDENGYMKASYYDILSNTLSGDISLPDYLTLNGYMSISSGLSSDFVFSNHQGVFSANFGDTSVVTLVDYTNSDFPGYYVDNICIVDSTHIFGSYYNLQYGGLVTTMMTSVDASQLQDKNIVLLGSYRLPSSVRKQILKFNTENEVYRIVVNEYSLYDTMADNSFGCKKLEQDIIAGNSVDLTVIDPGKMNIYALANQSKLLPVSYIANADNEFSSDAYLMNVFDAYAINGMDYIFVYDFMYRTFIGNSSIVGNGTTWSVRDFNNTLAKAPSGEGVMYAYNTQEDYLYYLVKFSANEYIDLENKKTNFNCSDFIDLINYGAKCPVVKDNSSAIYSYIGDSYRNGDVLLIEENVTKADGFWNDAFKYFDGNASVIGFPSHNETSSVIEYYDTPIMIMSEGNINGAWAFTKSFYSFDYQSTVSNAIPVHKMAFDVWGNNAIANENYSGVNELGESFTVQTTYFYRGKEYVIPDIAVENVEAIKQLIVETTKASCYDEVIRVIIEEELTSCYESKQTAKQAASNIDSRVSDYLFN